ncbi:MAG: hypothetical protein R2697_05665 [Ilumatobacteraceae bacterium]
MLGVGWRIVSPFPVVLDDDLADWFASIDGVVSVVDPAAPDDPNTRRWFDSHGRHAVLQRPDFHDGAAPATDVELARLLVRLRAARGFPHENRQHRRTPPASSSTTTAPSTSPSRPADTDPTR